MKKMYLWQIGIYGIVAAVAAIFWIQDVVVGAKEVAIRYGYEQYYFHLFAARPLLYFALGALGVTVLQWAGGMLLRRGARRACLVLGIVLAVSYAGCILCLLFGQILPNGFPWSIAAFINTEHALWLVPGALFALGFGESRAKEQ